MHFPISSIQIYSTKKHNSPLPTQLRHPRKPLAAAPAFSSPTETDSLPTQAYSGNLRPRPPNIKIPSILEWGGASECARGLTGAAYGDIENCISHVHYFVVVWWLPRDFFVPSMARTCRFVSLSRTTYRACQNGVKEAGVWHVARMSESSFCAHGFSVLFTCYFSNLYYWECKGDFTLSCLLCQ